MGDTHRSKEIVISVIKPDSSHVTNETKERDCKSKVLDKKMVYLENKNRALQEEINEIKETTDCQFSLLRDHVSSIRAKLKSQEDDYF